MKHLHPINITKRHQQIFCLLIGLLWAFTSTVSAQNDRSFIRQGNRLYQAHKWTAAEVQYRKAVAQNAHNPQAVYNLGCALMMQQKDSLALQQFAKSADMQINNKTRRAKSYHNMGVIMQNHQDFAKAIECYKMALRNNPQDNETRYNLALCKHQLKNQQNQQNQNKNGNDKNNNCKNAIFDADKNNKNKQNKNQDKNKNKNKNQDKDKDKNKNQDKQNNNKNDNKNNNQSNQSDKDKMSRDNAEQLLNAAVQQEKATKQKMQKAMSQPRRKQYDKNW